VIPDIPVRRELELVIEPHTDEYGRLEDRWRAQVATLHRELQARVDAVERGRLVPGTKGTIDELIVALGSAGAFTAMIECFHAWLGRDKTRRIDVRWDEDGAERFVTFRGDAVDAETLREGKNNLSGLQRMTYDFFGKIADWFHLDSDHRSQCAASDDAFDAVIAAFNARAAALPGGVSVPEEGLDVEVAQSEGWIAVPTCSLAELDPRPPQPGTTGDLCA
jgi:Effector Associated Constant Component 1